MAAFEAASPWWKLYAIPAVLSIFITIGTPYLRFFIGWATGDGVKAKRIHDGNNDYVVEKSRLKNELALSKQKLELVQRVKEVDDVNESIQSETLKQESEEAIAGDKHVINDIDEKSGSGLAWLNKNSAAGFNIAKNQAHHSNKKVLIVFYDSQSKMNNTTKWRVDSFFKSKSNQKALSTDYILYVADSPNEVRDLEEVKNIKMMNQILYPEIDYILLDPDGRSLDKGKLPNHPSNHMSLIGKWESYKIKEG